MSQVYLKALATLVRTIVEEGRAPRRVAFLGYPDFTAPPEAYTTEFGPHALERLEDRPNAAQLRAIHGRPEASIVPTVESVFRLMTDAPFEIEILDFQYYAGNEVLMDLSQPVREALHGRYGLVVDGGTLEHVFNIAQAFSNCAAMTALQGFVLHALPMNAFNHGFWNLNPNALVEFHEANGFATSLLKLNAWHSDALFDVQPFSRFHLDTHREVNLLYVARRVEPQEAFRFPVQRRYQDANAWR